MKISSLGVIICFFYSYLSFAQTPKKEPVDLYLQVSGSMNAYKGDLSPAYQKWSSAFHVGIVSFRGRWLNPTASLSFGSLTGQKTDYNYLAPPPRANTFFKTNFTQLSLGMRINVVKTDHVVAYLQPNIGLMRFTPRDIRNEKLADKVETRALGETLPTTTLTFPLHIGAMYRFEESDVAIGAEVGILNPMTKYLDNIGEYGGGGRDNSMQIKLSVYAPLTRIDAEAERKKQAEKKLRREEWLRKQGLLDTKTDENKSQTPPKVKTEVKKLTPIQRKRQKAKEKAEKAKKKKAAQKAKALEKRKKQAEEKKSQEKKKN